MTRLAAPLDALSGAMSPNFLFGLTSFGDSRPWRWVVLWTSVLLRGSLDSSNSASVASVRVAEAGLLTGDRVAALGLAAMVGSVGDRVNDVFELSRFRARTVEPGADPRTGFRRVVVFDLATPLRERTESETKTL